MYRSEHSSEGVGTQCNCILDGEELVCVSVALTTGVSLPQARLPKDLSEGRELDVSKNEYKLLSGENEGKLWINGAILPTKPNVLFKLTTRVKINPKMNTRLSGYGFLVY